MNRGGQMLNECSLPKPNWNAFFEYLPVLLERIGMNRYQLAKELNYHPSIVSHWSSGRAHPTPEGLQRMADKLREAFRTPLEMLDWMELAGWRPPEENLRRWFPRWFAEHGELPRGPRLTDQRYLLRPAEQMVGRENEMTLVQAWLTSVEGFRQPTVKVLVVGGMAGVGKTTLARAIGENPLIDTYFRDGVLWAQLGQHPDPRLWMEEWASLLGWTPWSAESAKQYLARFLADEERRVLLILDDVWPDTPFDPLISLAGPQCRVLITSRALTVAGVYERSRLLHLGLPHLQEAAAMAKSMLGGRPGGAEPAEVDRILVELVEAVGRLPIAIRVAVAAAQMDGLETVVHRLQPGEAGTTPRPERVRRLEVAGADPRNWAVWTAFEVGYEALEEGDRRRFRALGNLPVGMSFGVKVLAALWEEDEEVARDEARRLAERSLVERVGRDRYRLHDLLHDFAAGLLEERGERDTEGKWTQRLTGALVGRPRWWRATVPLVWIGPKRFTRAWWMQGWEDFLAMRQHFIDLLKKRWREKGVTAEMWAVGMVINRRIERLMRGFWRIVVWIAALALIGGAILWAGNHRLFDWAAWPRWAFAVMDGVLYGSLLAFVFACWALTFAIIDFYRLYHMPIEVLEGKEVPDSAELANPIDGSL